MQPWPDWIGKRQPFVPAHRRAGVVGDRALAADLVEAVAHARAGVVELLDELAGVEVRPAIALVVHALAVEHLRPALRVEVGQPVEGQDVGDDAGHHLGDRRAARHLDDRLVGDDLVHRRRLRRIRLRGLHAAPRRARAPRDDRLRVLGDVLQLLDERPAARDAVDAVVGQRRIAFDREDVVALVLRDRLLERLLGLVTGRRHQRVVVVERDHRQHDVLGERVRRADERLGAAGALEAVQPDHRRARLGLHRLRDLLRTGVAEAERCRGQAAELEEAPARDPLPPHHFV